MCQQCVHLWPMRVEDHGICVGVQPSVGPLVLVMSCMVVKPMQSGPMRPPPLVRPLFQCRGEARRGEQCMGSSSSVWAAAAGCRYVVVQAAGSSRLQVCFSALAAAAAPGSSACVAVHEQLQQQAVMHEQQCMGSSSSVWAAAAGC
ncbi:hypothetical protein QJQ45_015274, partial [Haematococcus lacustris]